MHIYALLHTCIYMHYHTWKCAPLCIITHEWMHLYASSHMNGCTFMHHHTWMDAPLCIITHEWMHLYVSSHMNGCTFMYHHTWMDAPLCIITHVYAPIESEEFLVAHAFLLQVECNLLHRAIYCCNLNLFF